MIVKTQTQRAKSATQYWKSLSPRARSLRIKKQNTSAANESTRKYWKTASKAEKAARMAQVHKSRIGSKHSEATKIALSKAHKLWWKRNPEFRIFSSEHCTNIGRGLSNLWKQLTPKELEAKAAILAVSLSKAHLALLGTEEKVLYQNLRALKVKVVLQHPIGKYIVDLFLPEYDTAVECDGLGHHNEKLVKAHDQIRDLYFKRRGVAVIHVPYSDIQSNPNKTARAIVQRLNQ